VVAFLGYGAAVMPPGIADYSQAFQTAHHLLLAHGKAVAIYRQGGYGGEIGIIIDSEYTTPASDSDADRAACQRYSEFDTLFFTEALFTGQYPPYLIDWIGPMAPKIEPDDMQLIHQPLDFLGVNYYRGTSVAFHQQGGFLKIRETPLTLPMWGYTEVGWGVYPPGLTEVLVNLDQRYPIPKFFITENGCATRDQPDQNGFVRDVERIDYLRGHIAAAAEAIRAGVNLKGYFPWSILDNLEWSEGYSARFGMVRVDYTTQARIPKQSYHWYRDVIARNGIDL
jgi:beta-glucosidase